MAIDRYDAPDGRLGLSADHNRSFFAVMDVISFVREDHERTVDESV